MKSNRRDFVRTCGVLTSGLLCGGVPLLLSGCSSIRTLKYDMRDETLIVNKSEFFDITSGVIRRQGFPAPILVSQLDNNDYSAVLLECTHRSCEVRPAGEILICPCHGSEFSKTGKVLLSPAEEDLHRFRVNSDADNIYILINSNYKKDKP